MGMWIIIIVELLAIPIGIWILFLRKKSRWFMISSIFLIVQGPIAASITAYLSFGKNPSLQNTGVLTPKYKTSYQQENSSIHLYGDTTSQKINVQMKDNEIIQPFGRNVPFSLKKTKEGILISVRVRSIDENIVAEVRENKWLINQNNYFKKNFDEHALEVVGQDGVTYLQVEYLNATTLKIGGVFFAESANISDTDRDFPSVPDNVGEVALFKVPANNMIIWGKGFNAPREQPRNQSDIDEIFTMAKRYIEPWFDYSDPEKIGIRKKQEVDKSVVISKSDRKKYSKLTNEQLKAKALTFVHDLRELLSMCDKEIKTAWDTFKSGGDLNALRAFESDECKKRTEAEYNRRFKIEAIILRDELISRTPNISVDSLPSSFYENPVNLFVCDAISNDLEKLANNL